MRAQADDDFAARVGEFESRFGELVPDLVGMNLSKLGSAE